MTKAWKDIDWSEFCCSCGKKTKTYYLAGDSLPMCKPCCELKMRAAIQAEPVYQAAEAESRCTRRLVKGH